MNAIEITENFQRLVEFIPEVLKTNIECNLSIEKQIHKRNDLSNTLQKLSFKEIVYKNDIYEDYTISKLIYLYEKFEKNDRFLQLITDHIKDEVEFIFENSIKTKVKTKKKDYHLLLKNLELLIFIEDKFKKIDLKIYKDSCLQILNEKFCEVQNLDKNINMLNNSSNFNSAKLKLDFRLLKELAEVETWLFKNHIKINPFAKYGNKLKEVQDKILNIFQVYKNNLKSEMDSKKSLDFSSIKNTITFINVVNEILPSIKTDISSLVIKKQKQILSEIDENIEKLFIKDRKFQAYFEETFMKIQVNSLRTIDIQSMFKDYFSNQDLKINQDDINGKLIQKMNKLFDDLDEQIDSLLNSNKNFSDNTEEISTKFYNGYLAVISFKVKMPKTYEHFFAKKENVNDILIDKIQKKLDDLIICVNNYSRNIKSGNHDKENFEKICNTFIDIKNISNIFYMFKTEIDLKLDKLLNNFIKVNSGFEMIGKLALQLRNNSIGKLY